MVVLYVTKVPTEESFLPSEKGLPYDDMHPLLIFYDCEATGGSIYDDNITSVLKN